MSNAVSLQLKLDVLNWKFDNHDNSEDGFLQSSEFYRLRTDLIRLLHCDALLDHIETLLDSDNDKETPLSLSRQDFQKFFISELKGAQFNHYT